jgi:hypothetical protein
MAGVGRAVRWGAAGLVTAAAFGVVTWVAGAFLLPLVMTSSADRWVVAAGLGVAVAALAGLWGQSWATREPPAGPAAAAAAPAAAGGARSVTAAGDITGIASTGDGATNTQHP